MSWPPKRVLWQNVTGSHYFDMLRYVNAAWFLPAQPTVPNMTLIFSVWCVGCNSTAAWLNKKIAGWKALASRWQRTQQSYGKANNNWCYFSTVRVFFRISSFKLKANLCSFSFLRSICRVSDEDEEENSLDFSATETDWDSWTDCHLNLTYNIGVEVITIWHTILVEVIWHKILVCCATLTSSHQ